VDHAPARGRDQCFGERDREVQNAREREPACDHQAVERLPLDQLHGEEANARVLLDREQRDDVGMAESRHRARLALEARQALPVARECLGEHLERHLPPEPGVERPVHLPHAARAERGDDLVGPEAGAGSEGHWGNLADRGAGRETVLPAVVARPAADL
jgi:hypothetical protein